MNNNKKWYRLDNTGKIYPSITSTRVSTVFRISATLTTNVDPNILQQALNNIIERFPYFKVNLRRGLFWYYFEYVNHNPIIKREYYYPCMFMFFKKKKTFPFRVLYYERKISCEFSHSITDGTGALKFLQSLVVEYFQLLGIDCDIPKYIFDKDSHVKQEEYEDSSHKYYKKGIPYPDYPKKAMHFPFKLNQKGEYYIITGIIDVSKLKERSIDKGCSITELLLVLFFETIQDYIYYADGGKRRHLRKRIVINLPVNLRKIFKSNTMRNFFISVTPFIDLRLGRYSRDELIKLVRNYMELNINEKHLSQYISRNVKNEKNKLLRIIPLFIKNLMIPIVYQKFGERGYTSGLSNLGLVRMPKEIEKLIERFEFYPPPSKGNIIKMGVASYRDKIFISFGRLTEETEIEKIFFRKIRKMEIPVKIETNLR